MVGQLSSDGSSDEKHAFLRMREDSQYLRLRVRGFVNSGFFDGERYPQQMDVADML